MAHVVSQPIPSFSLRAGFHRVVDVIRTRRAQSSAFHKLRAELEALSDRELADVGIARADITQIARDYAATK